MTHSGDAIDLIYDHDVAEEKRKHGTKYEILAAIAFKTLEREHRVIHDLRLHGPGRQTRHQIDVTVERTDGRRLRLIIECRHLFASSRRSTIDLDAVRSFASVVRDLQPDRGMMLTTVGYTKDARIYAEEEGIVLGVLREFKEDDWDGRVQKVVIQMDISVPASPRVAWIARDDAEADRISALLDTQGAQRQATSTIVNYFYDDHGNEIETLYDVLDPFFRRVRRENSSVESGREMLDEVRWVRVAGELVAVIGFEWEFPDDDTHITEELVVTVGDRVAKLLLQTFDGELDHVIFDRDLAAFEVAASGEIVPRLV